MADRRGTRETHTPNGRIQSDRRRPNVMAMIEGREIIRSQKKFTIYKIKVAQGDDTWYIFRRYSDFVLLKDKLQCTDVLPPGFYSRVELPGKRLIRDNFSVTFLDARQEELQRYLAQLINREGITDAACIKQFFRLREMQPEPVRSQNNRLWPTEHDENRAMAQNELGNEWRRMRQEVQDCQRQVLEMQREAQKRLLEMEDYMKSILKKNAWSTYPVEVINNQGYLAT